MCFVSVLAHLRVKMYQGITYQKHNGNIGEQSLVYYYITGHPCSPIQHVEVLNKMNVSNIIVSNRTKKKAEDLKLHFKNLKVLDWGNVDDFDVIINATSLGLNKETINIDFSKFGNNKLFYDVIYNPVETNFLKEGKKLGNKTENGKLMFIYQAFEAFKLWHEIEPSINSETLEILSND